MDDVRILNCRGPSGFRVGIYTAMKHALSLSVGV